MAPGGATEPAVRAYGVTAARTPAPTPKPKVMITTHPHLVAVGPMTLDIKPVAGPRHRNPPLLPTPTPKPVIETDPAADSGQPELAPATPPPSAFSPDAPPMLLPPEKPAPTPPPEKKEPKPSVLSPEEQAEPDLKDAVMYFDTPVGPHGARATIPLVIPNSAAPVPLPESRATYRKEKDKE